MKKIATLLVHPSEIYFEGMRAVLASSRYEIAWRADISEQDAESAAASILERIGGEAGAALVLIGAGGGAALCATIETLRERRPDVRIALFGSDFSSGDVAAALTRGANGMISSKMRAGAIEGALDVVMNGAVVMPPEMLAALIAREPAPIAATRRAHGVAEDRIAPRRAAAPRAGAFRPELRPEAAPADPVSDPECDQGESGGAVVDFAAPAGASTSKPAALLRAAELARSMTRRGTLSTARPALARFEPDPAPHAAPDPQPLLSYREAEILRCLVRGESNKEIARTLDLAETTVKVHLKAITRKICVRNRTQAAIWAYDNLGLRDEAIDVESGDDQDGDETAYVDGAFITAAE